MFGLYKAEAPVSAIGHIGGWVPDQRSLRSLVRDDAWDSIVKEPGTRPQRPPGNGCPEVMLSSCLPIVAVLPVGCCSIPVCRFPIFCSLHQLFERFAAFEQRTLERGFERVFGAGVVER